MPMPLDSCFANYRNADRTGGNSFSTSVLFVVIKVAAFSQRRGGGGGGM